MAKEMDPTQHVVIMTHPHPPPLSFYHPITANQTWNTHKTKKEKRTQRTKFKILPEPVLFFSHSKSIL